MKKLLTGLCFIGIPLLLKSQIALTANEIGTIGDTITLNLTDTISLTIPQGGTGMQWDYSQVKLQTNSIQYRYSQPTGTDFSNANLLEDFSGTGGIGGGAIKNYYYRTSNQMQLVGIEQTSLKIKTTSQPDIYTFPVNVGDKNSQTYSTNYKGVGGFTTTYRQGKIYSEGMGTGILKTPGGNSFNQAILVKFVHEYTDSTPLFTSSLVIRTQMEQYIWFEKGKRGQIFVIQKTRTGIGSNGNLNQGPTVGLMKNLPVVPNSLENVLKSEVRIFPNPCVESINIQGLPLNTTVYLTGSNGILLGRFTPIQGICQIHVTHLPAGLYWLNWKENGRLQSKTFSVFKE